MNRRQALSMITAGLASVVTALYAVPFLGQLLSPLRRQSKAPSSDFLVGHVSDFPVGEPRRVSFLVQVVDGWETKQSERAAWVLKEAEGRVRVFSGTCPHLGCSVAWKPAAAEFHCPCHHARFARDGALAEGPAQRGLDELPASVSEGEVRVRWVDFVPGGEESEPVGGTSA